MTTNPPNVEATNVAPQERVAQWMPVYCRGCGVQAKSITTKSLVTLYKCPQCGRTGKFSRPTEPPPRRYF